MDDYILLVSHCELCWHFSCNVNRLFRFLQEYYSSSLAIFVLGSVEGIWFLIKEKSSKIISYSRNMLRRSHATLHRWHRFLSFARWEWLRHEFSSDQDLLLEPWITLVGFSHTLSSTICSMMQLTYVNLLEWRYLQLRLKGGKARGFFSLL